MTQSGHESRARNAQPCGISPARCDTDSHPGRERSQRSLERERGNNHEWRISMKILNLSRSAMVAAALTLTVRGFACAAFAQDAGVTFDRLKNAASEPQNWLLPYGDYTTRSRNALK